MWEEDALAELQPSYVKLLTYIIGADALVARADPLLVLVARGAGAPKEHDGKRGRGRSVTARGLGRGAPARGPEGHDARR